MKPDSLEKSAFLAKTKEADHDLFTLIQKHHGTISAEHGIGLLKKDYLGYCRTPDDACLKAIGTNLMDASRRDAVAAAAYAQRRSLTA